MVNTNSLHLMILLSFCFQQVKLNNATSAFNITLSNQQFYQNLNKFKILQQNHDQIDLEYEEVEFELEEENIEVTIEEEIEIGEEIEFGEEESQMEEELKIDHTYQININNTQQINITFQNSTDQSVSKFMGENNTNYTLKFSILSLNNVYICIGQSQMCFYRPIQNISMQFNTSIIINVFGKDKNKNLYNQQLHQINLPHKLQEQQYDANIELSFTKLTTENDSKENINSLIIVLAICIPLIIVLVIVIICVIVCMKKKQNKIQQKSTKNSVEIKKNQSTSNIRMTKFSQSPEQSITKRKQLNLLDSYVKQVKSQMKNSNVQPQLQTPSQQRQKIVNVKINHANGQQTLILNKNKVKTNDYI